jgi:hypothetical protein
MGALTSRRAMLMRFAEMVSGRSVAQSRQEVIHDTWYRSSRIDGRGPSFFVREEREQ